MRTRSLKLLAALVIVIAIANVSSTASAKIKISTPAIDLNQNVRIVGINEIQPRIVIGALNSINTISVIKSGVEITNAIPAQDLNRIDIPMTAISNISIGFCLATIRPQIAANIAANIAVNKIDTLTPIVF